MSKIIKLLLSGLIFGLAAGIALTTWLSNTSITSPAPESSIIPRIEASTSQVSSEEKILVQLKNLQPIQSSYFSIEVELTDDHHVTYAVCGGSDEIQISTHETINLTLDCHLYPLYEHGKAYNRYLLINSSFHKRKTRLTKLLTQSAPSGAEDGAQRRPL